jgi:RNA polymerase primary sigma factor
VGVLPGPLRDLVRRSRQPLSLATPVGPDDAELGDLLEDKESITPADAAATAVLRNDIETLIETLTARERRVVQLRYGLIDGRERTLNEIGNRVGVSRESIRQIEIAALVKLREPSRNQQLIGFLE